MVLTRVLGIAVLCFTTLPIVVADDAEKAAEKTISAGAIKLRVPNSWKQERTTSRVRVAQFQISGEKPTDEGAEVVVYYFGGPTGGVKANIDRWIGQFQDDGREVKVVTGKSDQGEYVLTDISGTWKKPVGPPMAARTTNQPGSRVINIILITETGANSKDYYFLRLSGPDALVQRNAEALRASIGANLDSEKPYEMEEEKVTRTEADWRKTLTAEQFRVLRMKGTERAFVNKFDKHFKPGTYACAACGQELFASETKFNSGCGWPAFYAAKAGERVTLSRDLSLGRARVEVCCARCDSHLGHIFDDAPQTPTGQRYCINSVSLKFIPAPADEDKEDDR